MYTVKMDPLRNRLYVTMSGHMLPREMKDCTDRTISAARKLKPGYDVITDISRCQVLTHETLAEVKRAQEYLARFSAGHSLRVRGGAILTSIQFANAGKSMSYLPCTVATIADAERYLDKQKAQTSGIK
jgi:hypothetical protein